MRLTALSSAKSESPPEPAAPQSHLASPAASSQSSAPASSPPKPPRTRSPLAILSPSVRAPELHNPCPAYRAPASTRHLEPTPRPVHGLPCGASSVPRAHSHRDRSGIFPPPLLRQCSPKPRARSRRAHSLPSAPQSPPPPAQRSPDRRP